MGRKPRIEFNGGVYHIIQRGNNREYIFKKEEYKTYLMGIIKRYKEIMDYQIYGFVFMDNHYHIVLRTYDVPLHEIMHRINTNYSKYYNYKNKRTGHVFEKRYKGILVKDDKYLLSLIRYVHQNPVNANMCKKVNQYYWSSDSFYRKNKQGQMVDIDFILNIFSEDRVKAIKEYKKFMDSNEMEESKEFEETLVIGEKKLSSIDIMVRPQNKKSLDDILHEVVQSDDDFDAIKNSSRKRSLTLYKREYIKTALYLNYKMKEIGANIGISDTAVYYIHNK